MENVTICKMPCIKQNVKPFYTPQKLTETVCTVNVVQLMIYLSVQDSLFKCLHQHQIGCLVGFGVLSTVTVLPLIAVSLPHLLSAVNSSA